VKEEQDDLTLVYMWGFKRGQESMKDEIARLRAALEDIANERGICLTCGKLAIRGPRGAVFCDPHLFGIDQGCRWSPQNPIDLARAALEGEKTNETD